MKKGVLIFLLMCVLSFSGCGKTQVPDANVDMTVREISSSPTQDVKSILEDSLTAVVGISVDFNDGYSIGSGVCVSQGGFIVTNFHVVEGSESINLYYADKTTGSASLIWAEPNLDLAILKSSREIPYLSTQNLDQVYVGQEIYSIGTPLTLQFKHTVTKGIVSAKDRILETQSTYGASFLQNLIQHDSSINPGNSGGPLINESGKVIGINTLKASEGEGIGFAVPVEIAQIVIGQLEKNNAYQTPYVGIFGFDGEMASIYGEDIAKDGVYIASTSGEAFEKGLRKGDLIFDIDGQSITNLMDFRVAIYKKNVGDSILIKYSRAGEINSVYLTLQKRT